MVRAWYMDDDLTTDQRLEHHRNPPAYIDLKELYELTGVKYFKVCKVNLFFYKHLQKFSLILLDN